MIKNILIIGCGLIGSSILRAVHSQKASKNIYIFEKSKKNISIIKKLKISCKILKKIENISVNFDLIILCTPMSQYSRIILKLNKFINDQGKIVPRRVTGTSAKMHRKLVTAIKRARNVALLPFAAIDRD